MSTQNICFCGEIRKTFGLKKTSYQGLCFNLKSKSVWGKLSDDKWK